MVHHFHQFNICHLILVVLSTSSSTPKVGVFFIPPKLVVHHFHQFNICHLILVVLSTSSSTPKVGVFFIPPLLGVCFYQILVVIFNFIDYFAPYFGDYFAPYFGGFFQLCRLLCTVIWWLFLSALTIFHHRLKVTFFHTECFHH